MKISGFDFHKQEKRSQPAADWEAETIVLPSPGSRQMGKPGQQQLPLVGRQSADEVRPLAEHVEQVEHRQYHIQVKAGEQEAEVLHGAVQVAGERMLDQKGCEVEGP